MDKVLKILVKAKTWSSHRYFVKYLLQILYFQDVTLSYD